MFAKDGYSNIAFAIIIAIVICIAASYAPASIAYTIYGLVIILLGLILFFFRDPDRKRPYDQNVIVAPADGKIVLIKEVEESHYIKGKATQISIFLSLLDIHVNRVPASGTIEYIHYNPGVYLMAWDERASSMNERADFGLRHSSGTKLFFRQITGFMARRIVYHLKEGDQVKVGARFGMMKFGSRMDILVPHEVNIEVEEGSYTVGGETVLARLKNV